MSKIKENTLAHLIGLECMLLESSTRQNSHKLSEIIDEEFYEISANGKMIDKLNVLQRLPYEVVPQFYNQNFNGRMVDKNTAQLTYQSAYRLNKKVPLQFSLRMSLWKKVEEQWHLFFHQGTPCSKFTILTE